MGELDQDPLESSWWRGQCSGDGSNCWSVGKRKWRRCYGRYCGQSGDRVNNASNLCQRPSLAYILYTHLHVYINICVQMHNASLCIRASVCSPLGLSVCQVGGPCWHCWRVPGTGRLRLPLLHPDGRPPPLQEAPPEGAHPSFGHTYLQCTDRLLRDAIHGSLPSMPCACSDAVAMRVRRTIIGCSCRS